MRTWSFVILAALVTSCASSPRYTYHPTAQTAREDAPAKVGGYVAADYHVPRGEVRVAALGLTRVNLPDRARLRSVRAFQVRMVVHNGDEQPWVVNANRQQAVIEGSHHEGPVSSTCDGQVMGIAVLMPGETRTVNLYYELAARAPALPSVRVEWSVATPARVIARRSTAFEPHAIPRPRLPVPRPDPKAAARQLERSRTEPMPLPGRAEATGWPSWRD